MVFIETSVFTRQVKTLLSDESYGELQRHLQRLPTAGAMIPGSGGCRKVRWRSEGRGKRGGVRVIYYWISADDRILMLLAYSKSESADLEQAQIKTLARLVKSELEQE